MKIRKGDTVQIISSKDRGKKGKVLGSFPKGQKFLVEGINLRKKHLKPQKEGEKGQIVELVTPIHISHLRLVCPKCGKATRIGYETKDNKKNRICKKCSQKI